MSSIQNWSIRRRLLLAFAGVLIPYLALASVGALGLGLLWGTIGEIRKHAMGDMVVAADLQLALAELLVQADDYLITADPVERGEFKRRLAKVREVLARVKSARLQHPEERRAVAEIEGRIAEIEALGREILALRDPRGDRAATAKAKALGALSEESMAALRRFREANVEEVAEAVERGAALMWRIAGLGLAMLLASVAGGVGLALVFSRWIGGPLLAIAEGSRRMAEGDLSARVNESGGAELAVTARAFNTMAEQLDRSFAALAERTRQMETLHLAARVLATEVDQARLLQVIVGTAREVVEARYGALAILGKDGKIAQFFTAGLTPEERDRIGPLPEGRGLLGHVFKDGQTLRLDDLSTHPAAVGFPPGHPPMRNLLAAPIRFRGEILGALFLTEKPGGFTANDEALLTTLCADAAAAMENARLFEESEQRRRAAQALAAVGRDLVQSLDLAVVGQRIIESINQLLRVRFSSLYRLEPGSGDLVAVAVSENMASIIGPGLVFPKGTGAIGLAVKERRLVVSEDVLADPRVTFTPEVRARVEQASFRAIIALPLLGKEGVIGVLGLGDKRGRVFDAEEIGLAQAFADQATLALENARLYEESDARRRQAEALAAVGRDLARSLALEEVAQRITDSVCQLISLGTARLYRLEPTSGSQILIAASGKVAQARPGKFVLPSGVGATGLAVRDRTTVVSPDVLTDSRITVTPEVRDHMVIRAVIAVPLLVKERAIGVLVVGDEAGRVFDAEEIRLAETFADQAALALENARLFEEAQRALADLRTAQGQLIEGATMRALGELASGAAHHLNNLMAIVLGRVRLMLSDSKSAPVRRPLEVIERAAVDAAEVVRRVSRFARMEPMEEWKPLDLKQLAAEVLEMTRARWEDEAQAQGIRIEATFDGQDVPPVAGNAAALREVLLNVVLNAVDALPSGGQIRLRTFCEDDWVGLAVSDTGTGMSGEVKERALEPFFTTKGPKSMGLGLSVSYGILQRHGGKLTVESAEGQGSTVTIRLPVHASPIGGRPGIGAEPVRAATRALRILVIDDDDEVREVVVEMLAAQGHTVLQASGGRQGLALLEAGERMDLVLTDLGMPEMNGWDVARAIRGRWPGLPVGMLTGWGEQIAESSADRQMVAGILVKPATPESLQEFIAACPGATRGT